MSSPGGMPLGGPLWQGMQPQTPAMASEVQAENGVSIRPMRLKVLYTFDDQNKTNCLARWPHVLSIQTISLDETTTIGVVELQTCIKAVVECSPELIPRMDKDYTVYAYDYSEYDNPLVGQGMLSRALAAASPTPGAPASHSRQLITGRVCKNILGLFTNGVKETLEVKLRLVPVPKAVQGGYFTAMEKYREMGRGMGTDLTEWASYLHYPNGGSQTGNITTTQQRDGRSMEVVNQLLSPSPVLLQQPAPEQLTQPAQHFQPLQPVQPPGRESPLEANQVAAPKGKAAKGGRAPSKAATKRPRAKRPPKNPAPSGGNTSGYEEGTDADDGPLPKKRAKITQTDWKSKSSFASAPDSLLVAASTAGSLRLFRPIAVSGGPNATNHLQEIPRVPTPVPTAGDRQQRQDQANAPSGPRRLSVVSQAGASPTHTPPYPQVDSPAAVDEHVRPSIESPDRSPERNGSLAGTPPDIRSSPPVMRGSALMRSSPPCPSSPDLPPMPRMDSGFMSGSIDDLFEEDEDMVRPIDDEDSHIASQYDKRPIANQGRAPANKQQGRFFIEEECPGPPELLPTRMPIKPPKVTKATSKASRSRATSIVSDDDQTLPPLKKPRGKSKLPSPAPSQIDQCAADVGQVPKVSTQTPIPPATDISTATNAIPGSTSSHQHKESTSQPPSMPPTTASSQTTSETPSETNAGPKPRHLIRTASLGSLSLPTPALSDSVAPPPTLQRAMTYTELAFVTNDSDPAQFSTSEPVYSRTAQAKRDANQRRLEVALQNGEMPTFCENCGAIETPTWRKAWAEEIQGPPGYYEYSDEPGRVTMVVIINRDTDGAPTSHLIIKKFLLPKEDATPYREYYLCNPCGIWMSKYKSHRPEDRWDKPFARPAPPKKRPTQRAAKPKKSRGASNAHSTSETNYPQSEPNFPQGMDQSTSELPQCDGASPEESGEPGVQCGPAPEVRPRQGSERPIKRAHPLTSNAASAALRRAIQSSPAAKWGSQHSPIDVEDRPALGPTRRLLFPSPRKDGSSKVLGEVTTNIVHITPDIDSLKDAVMDMPDKENCPPAIEDGEADAELARLFEEEMARPTTPSQKTPSNPLKTPTRPVSNHRPVTRSVTRSNKGKKHLSPHRTPSKTPGSLARRRSPRYQDQVFESPFTASLNQLMSDANTFSPSRNNTNLEIDFGSLPDLPAFDHNTHTDLNFPLTYDNEDIFSTDIPMPSSPPRPFRLYEDPLTSMDSVNWNDFAAFDMDGGKLDTAENEVEVKQEPEEDDHHGEADARQDKERAE